MSATLRFSTVLVAVAGFGLTASFAFGNSTGFEMTYEASSDPGAIVFDPGLFGTEEQNTDGSYTYLGAFGGQMFNLNWDVTVNPDPFIVANISVTNDDLLNSQDFSLLMLLPVAPTIDQSTATSGSVIGTLTNQMFAGGATMTEHSVRNGPLYTAWIDGLAHNSLYDSPFAFATAPVFNAQAPIPANGFNDVSPGTGVQNSIAILLEFTLSAGARVDITAVFNVEEVPAPGVLSLLVLGGLATGRRRRHA